MAVGGELHVLGHAGNKHMQEVAGIIVQTHGSTVDGPGGAVYAPSGAVVVVIVPVGAGAGVKVGRVVPLAGLSVVVATIGAANPYSADALQVGIVIPSAGIGVVITTVSADNPVVANLFPVGTVEPLAEGGVEIVAIETSAVSNHATVQSVGAGAGGRGGNGQAANLSVVAGGGKDDLQGLVAVDCIHAGLVCVDAAVAVVNLHIVNVILSNSGNEHVVGHCRHRQDGSTIQLTLDGVGLLVDLHLLIDQGDGLGSGTLGDRDIGHSEAAGRRKSNRLGRTGNHRGAGYVSGAVAIGADVEIIPGGCILGQSNQIQIADHAVSSNSNRAIGVGSNLQVLNANGDLAGNGIDDTACAISRTNAQVQLGNLLTGDRGKSDGVGSAISQIGCVVLGRNGAGGKAALIVILPIHATAGIDVVRHGLTNDLDVNDIVQLIGVAEVQRLVAVVVPHGINLILCPQRKSVRNGGAEIGVGVADERFVSAGGDRHGIHVLHAALIQDNIGRICQGCCTAVRKLNIDLPAQSKGRSHKTERHDHSQQQRQCAISCFIQDDSSFSNETYTFF